MGYREGEVEDDTTYKSEADWNDVSVRAVEEEGDWASAEDWGDSAVSEEEKFFGGEEQCAKAAQLEGEQGDEAALQPEHGQHLIWPEEQTIVPQGQALCSLIFEFTASQYRNTHWLVYRYR